MMGDKQSKNERYKTRREDDSLTDSNNIEGNSEKEENVTGPEAIVDPQTEAKVSKKEEDDDKINNSPNQDLNIGEGSQKGAECQDSIKDTMTEREQLSDADRKTLERLNEELSRMSPSITRGVKKTVDEVQVVGFLSSKDFKLVKDLDLEDKFSSRAYTVAKNFVDEVTKAMYVTLCDTEKMKELERWYKCHKIKRGEDGKVYGVEICYTMRAQKNTELIATSDSSSYRADSEVKPIIMMFGYKIIVKKMKGKGKDLPNESGLAGLKF